MAGARHQQLSREPNFSAKGNDNSVILVLRRSETLRRLQERHPRQLTFQVRMPKDTEITKHTISVEYR
jgi:hypothetical protein